MKLKKKLAAIIAMAAVCSSLTVPVTAKAAICEHDWKQIDTNSYTYTEQHGYAIGEDVYRNCVITRYVTEYLFKCEECRQEFTLIEENVRHSNCGL